MALSEEICASHSPKRWQSSEIQSLDVFFSWWTGKKMYFGVKCLTFVTNVQPKRSTERVTNLYHVHNLQFKLERLWNVRWNCCPGGNYLIGCPILHCNYDCNKRGKFEISSFPNVSNRKLNELRFGHENVPTKRLYTNRSASFLSSVFFLPPHLSFFPWFIYF